MNTANPQESALPQEGALRRLKNRSEFLGAARGQRVGRSAFSLQANARDLDEPGIGSCNDLHAAIILAVAAFAADFGSSIMWRNEYTGEWFEGYDGLDDFALNGVSALAWFVNQVQPALAEMGVK